MLVVYLFNLIFLAPKYQIEELWYETEICIKMHFFLLSEGLECVARTSDPLVKVNSKVLSEQ